ncbi:MAG: lipopolysaccharide biosynthesis protein [Promethearchaeia archaeon]
MDGSKLLIVAMFTAIMILPGVVMMSVVAGPFRPEQIGDSVEVAVVGADVAPSVVSSLRLDTESLEVNECSSVIDALSSPPDVLILADQVLTSGETTEVNLFVENGGGLLYLLGPESSQNGTTLQNLGVIFTPEIEVSDDTADVAIKTMTKETPLTSFDWSSAPTVQKMTLLPSVTDETTVLLANETGFETGGAPVLTRTAKGDGEIIVLTAWLTLDETGNEINEQLTLWPYFNYLTYSTATHLAGQQPLSYAAWPYSPVPHKSQQMIIGIVVLVLGITTVSAYRTMKRRSEEEEVLTEIERAELLVETEEEIDAWEEIGMHRQISGFLIQLFITLLIVIPRVVLSIMIYPRFIMPFPQASGWFSFSVNLFQGLWVVFDLGTSVALAKYFAEYRVDQPQEAVKYAQIFVWFQLITGMVQITGVAFIGSVLFPHTYLAHLSYVFIAHSLFQFPGFTLLFVHVFRGMNRIDLQQIINILYWAVFNIAAPYIMILVFRWWGVQNPIFGQALGGAIGQAVGMYFNEWLTFGVSVYLFKRLGFNVGTLFRVDFDMKQIKKALKFGAKWTVGAAAVPIVWFVQMLVVSTNLLNWSALQGQFQLAWDLAILVSVVGLFMESMLGGISEAYSHAKEKLTELYTAQALRWGAFFVFWLISGLAAVGARAILGAAGESWSYAAVLLQFFLVFQLMGFWSWLGDWVFAAAERTDLAAGVWILEQSIRAVGMVLFVVYEPVVLGVYLGGMPGIITAYSIALFCKNIAVWALIRRKITAPKLYVWQSYVGPALAAVANYLMLEFLSQLFWGGVDDLITSAILFFIATLPSLYFYSFVSGLTGAWDDNTLAEFGKSAKMVKVAGIGWLAKRFYGAVDAGAKISPLHDNFPIDVYESAMEEAQALTQEKKKLEI